MTLQQEASMRILDLSEEGLVFINQVLNAMSSKFFIHASPENSALENVDVSKRIGIAKGRFHVPDDFDQYNDEIADLFEGVAG